MQVKVPTKFSIKITINSALNNVYIFAIGLYIFAATITGANFTAVGRLSNFANILFNYIAYYLLMGVSIINVIFNTKWSRNKLYYTLIAGLLTFLMCVMGNNSLLLPFFVILGYPQDLELQQLAKAVFWVQVITVIIVIVGCLNGIFGDYAFIQHNVLRHSWGFTSPNTLGNYIAIILGEYVLIYWNKWSFAKAVAWFFILLVMWNYQNSRAAFYYGILIILLTILFKTGFIKANLANLLMWLPIILFTIGATVTIYAMIRFSKSQDNTYNFFNALFSGRLSFMTKFYNMYGLSWFGHTIQTVSLATARASNGFVSWMGLDSSYAYIAINDGIFGIIAYWLIFFFANLKVTKDKNWGGAMFLLLMVLMGLSENYIRLININFVFFVFASYIANAKIQSLDIKAQSAHEHKYIAESIL